MLSKHNMRLNFSFLFVILASSCGEKPYNVATWVDVREQSSDFPFKAGRRPALNALRSWPATIKQGRLVRKEIFDAWSSHDSVGFRKTPEAQASYPSRHLFMAGCSFTYGEGLDDDGPAAAQLAQLLGPQWHVLNQGKRGGHPFDHLYLWSLLDMKKLASESKGVFIYNLFSEQLERMRLAWHYLSWADPASLVFKKDAAGWIPYRPLQEEPRMKAMQLLKDWGLAAFFLRYHHPLTAEFETEDLTMLADVLAAIKHEYLAQYPMGRFVVTWMGHRPLFQEKKNVARLINVLSTHRIEVWLPPLVRSSSEWPMHIPADGHPSYYAQQAHAEFILRRLVAR